MATHSSILAWENSETEDHGGLQSMLLQRVRHNWVTQTTYLLYQTILYEYTINQWSGTQAWTKMESSKASKVFMKRRKRTIHMYRYIGRLRGRVPELLSRGLVAVFFFFFLNLYYGAFLLAFFWPVISICLVASTYLVYLRILSYVHMHLLAKMDSTKEASG